MQLGNGGETLHVMETYATSKAWVLSSAGGDGLKWVLCDLQGSSREHLYRIWQKHYPGYRRPNHNC